MRCSGTHPKYGQCILDEGHTEAHEIAQEAREAHYCHAKNCPTIVKPTLLMCAKHWRMVPKEMQDLVYSTYRRGQCTTKTPSREWHKAATDCIKYVADKEKK